MGDAAYEAALDATFDLDASKVVDLDAMIAELNEDLAGLYEDLYSEVGSSTQASLAAAGWIKPNDATGVVATGFGKANPAVAAAIQGRLNKVSGADETTYALIKAALAKGEQLGESIEQLAERVSAVFDQATGYRARTIARTEVIGAVNEASHLAAEAEGFNEMKLWLAASDGRVRDSHRHADGQRVKMDETFTIGGWPMRFPGDPSAPAREVINCRCTLLYEVAETVVNPVKPAAPKKPRAAAANQDRFGKQRKGARSWRQAMDEVLGKTKLKRGERAAPGRSILWDGGDIEDLNARVLSARRRLYDANAGAVDEALIETRFKMTQNAGQRWFDNKGPTWERESRLRFEKRNKGELQPGSYAWDGDGEAWHLDTDWGEIRVFRNETPYGPGNSYSFHNNVQIRVRADIADPEAAMAEAMDILGIRPGYPSATDLRRLQENRLVSIFKHGRGDASRAERAAALRRAEDLGITPSDVEVFEIPGGRYELRLSQDAANRLRVEANADLFYHDLYSVEPRDVVEVLAGDHQAGLSTTTRWWEGVGKSGQSSAEDVFSGGADFVFTRQQSLASYNPAGSARLVWRGDRVLRRTDWFAYTRDTYGVRNPNHHLWDRAVREDHSHFEALRGGTSGDYGVSGRETMFKGHLSFDDLSHIEVGADGREDILRGLRDRGVTRLGGRPIEDVVLTRDQARARMADLYSELYN